MLSPDPCFVLRHKYSAELEQFLQDCCSFTSFDHVESVDALYTRYCQYRKKQRKAVIDRVSFEWVLPLAWKGAASFALLNNVLFVRGIFITH